MSSAAEVPSPPRAPSLLPREHGAWGQLAMPVLTGLALGVPGPSALLLATAFVLAFAAHEPLLVVLGQRGRRLRDQHASRALRWGLALVLSGAGAGTLGFLLAPRPARIAILVPASLGAFVFLLAWLRLEKTTAGELLVAGALAACAAPLALASGAPPAWAWSSAFVWAASFGAATLPVRAILLLARSKGQTDRRPLAAVGVAAIVGLAALLAWRGTVPLVAAIAVLPTALAALALSFIPVRPQRLTSVGWSLVAASITSMLLLVIGLRLA